MSPLKEVKASERCYSDGLEDTVYDFYNGREMTPANNHISLEEPLIWASDETLPPAVT